MTIDTTKIDGFEEMSPEEKTNALLNFEFEDNSGELEALRNDNKKLKDLNSKYSSEIAENKKKDKAKLSEEERIKAENDEMIKSLKEQNEKLMAEIKSTSYVASFLKQGYDEELAKASADALITGDTEKLFVNIEKFNDLLRKKIEADVLKTMTPPSDKGRGGKKELTKEEFQKMAPNDRVKFMQDHPEEYKKMYGGK